MKLRAAAALLAFAAGTAAAQSTRDAEMQRGIAQRIEAAARSFETWSRGAAPGESATVLVSFSSHLRPDQVRRLFAGCNCRIEQLYRTVGEMQMALGGDARRIFDPAADAAVAADLASDIDFTLDDRRAPPLPPDLDSPPAELRRQARAKAALRTVASEARQGRATFTGVVLRARREALQALASKGAGDILAMERLQGSARPFAIPIDEYRRPPR
jgi:hypothetical protein